MQRLHCAYLPCGLWLGPPAEQNTKFHKFQKHVLQQGTWEIRMMNNEHHGLNRKQNLCRRQRCRGKLDMFPFHSWQTHHKLITNSNRPNYLLHVFGKHGGQELEMEVGNFRNNVCPSFLFGCWKQHQKIYDDPWRKACSQSRTGCVSSTQEREPPDETQTWHTQKPGMQKRDITRNQTCSCIDCISGS